MTPNKGSGGFRFTAEMFDEPYELSVTDFEKQLVADRANALLQAHLATLPVVYERDGQWPCWMSFGRGKTPGIGNQNGRAAYFRRRARLFNIEAICSDAVDSKSEGRIGKEKS